MNPILLSLTASGCGAAAGILFRGRPTPAPGLSPLFATAAAIGLLAASALVFREGSSFDLFLVSSRPFLTFHFAFTPLAALFTVVSAGLGLAASIYAFRYAEEYDAHAGALGFFYNLFLAGMALVPLAQNIFSFLFVWETMTLASFFLVLLEHKERDSRRAAYIYIVMSQAGTAFIAALFLLLWRRTGAVEFEAFRAAAPLFGAGLKNALFLLALVGFGTKAGIVPLHLWLPYAHPAAPSHVSALMSGAMIKSAVYGLVFVLFSFLGGGPAWWGALLLVTAAATALTGILYALMERDLKRLLAYSSVENMGILLMGVGAASLFHAFGQNALAALALAAALFHLLNHAVFKGLLFLAAGSVIRSLHTKNMEEMGGLIKRMPATAFLFLIGAMAISALPPLNGFAGEWLTLQLLLSGFGLPHPAARILCLLALAALALTGGLAAACFVKAFGITFLAQPRSERAHNAGEVSFWEILPMALLAFACLALGLFASPVVQFLKSIAEPLLDLERSLPAEGWRTLAGSYGAVSPAAIGMLLVLGALAAWLLPLLCFGYKKARITPTWACGLPGLSPRMEYSAAAFSKPFRMLFALFYKPVRELREVHAGSPYFPTAIHYSGGITQILKEKLYRPPLKLLLRGSHVARALQAGSINLYLGYLLATLVALLLFLFR